MANFLVSVVPLARLERAAHGLGNTPKARRKTPLKNQKFQPLEITGFVTLTKSGIFAYVRFCDELF